ncbi:MAG: FtsX-like permease family protein, partial [Gemmatimonadota bacterium]
PLPLSHGMRERPHDVLGAFDRIVREARSLPGVRAAHLVHRAPDRGRGLNLRAIRPEGLRDVAEIGASVSAVTPGYFEAAGIDVLEGRGVLDSDGPSAPEVAVVSRSFADRLLPPGPRVGARFRHHATPDGEPVEVTVVGIVADITPDPSEPPPPILYVPFAQLPMGSMDLVVRSEAPPGALLPALRERIWAVDSEVPLDAAYTLEEAVARSVASPRFYMLVVGAFAVLAVLLAAIGTYGVTAYGVSQRASEIGVRSALGADSSRILREFVSHALPPALLGIVIGLAAAAALSGALGGLLFGVAPLEPWVYAAVAIGLAAVSLCAIVLPARRAARMDPLLALRHE